jgi:hypothetical protein
MNRDIRDIVGGLAMMSIGAFMAWHAYNEYDIGRLARMGPGFFPVSLGIILSVIGLFIAIPAFFRPGSPIKVEFKTMLAVTLGILVFAFLLRTAGLILATMAAVLVSSVADRSITWKGRVILAVGVAGLTWGIFILGLGMLLPVWPWSH